MLTALSLSLSLYLGATVYITGRRWKALAQAAKQHSPNPDPQSTSAAGEAKRKGKSKRGHKHREPAARTGRVEEMAIAIFVFSTYSYINGETVAVDGGVMNELSSSIMWL